MVRYLEAVGQLAPETKLKSEMLIRQGYQRFMTFRNGDGGFGLFGGQPSKHRYTSMGLAQMYEMSKVIHVEEKVITGAREWLLRDEKTLIGHLDHNSANTNTAVYVIWSLLRAKTPTKRFAGLLKKLEAVTFAGKLDTYGEAIALRAFILAQPKGKVTRMLLDKFAAGVTQTEGAHWPNSGHTLMHGYGLTGDIELTALVAGGFLKADYQIPMAQSAVNWLIERRDPRGFWGSTGSTVQTMRVLLGAAEGRRKLTEDVTVGVAVNGTPTDKTILIRPGHDVVQTIDVTSMLKDGKNAVMLTPSEADLPMTYALVWRSYVPWKNGRAAAKKRLAIDVTYDTKEVPRGGLVTGKATIVYNGESRSGMVILDLGIPPGFMVDQSAVWRLPQTYRRIQRVEISGRQLTLYVSHLDPGKSVTFEYALRGRTPSRAKAPASEVWEYYNPDVRDRTVPEVLRVK